jgi:flagellar biosynthetic protein FliR
MTVEGWILRLLAALPALARITGIVVTASPFAARAVPRRVRVMFAIALAMGLSPAAGHAAMPGDLAGAAVATGGELLIGAAIGMAMSLLFVAARWIGEIAAAQLGLNLSETFDPRSDAARGGLGAAYWLLGVVIFLGVNGHHALVRGIRSSFISIPLFTSVNSASLLGMFSRLLSAATSLTARLAVPVFVTMLIVDLAVGMVGRTVPQVGLMTAGVTVRALAGLIVLMLAMALAAMLLAGASSGWFASLAAALVGK